MPRSLVGRFESHTSSFKARGGESREAGGGNIFSHGALPSNVSLTGRAQEWPAQRTVGQTRATLGGTGPSSELSDILTVRHSLYRADLGVRRSRRLDYARDTE